MKTTQMVLSEVKEVLDMPKRQFIEMCQEYIKEERDGELFDMKDPGKCPLAIWVAENGVKCARNTIPNTSICPLCGNPMCPECGNHVVDQLSRVTGYLQVVSGWNEAKKQEFEDRTRYDL